MTKAVTTAVTTAVTKGRRTCRLSGGAELPAVSGPGLTCLGELDIGRTRPHERKVDAMGLMDKVKAQATQLAEKAQEAGKVGQQKIGNLQTKKQADTLLRLERTTSQRPRAVATSRPTPRSRA